MSKPAKPCDECVHHLNHPVGESWNKPCALGHKPRFYLPQTMEQAHKGVWGWKRRCSDFLKIAP